MRGARTLPDLLRRSAERNPDAEAVRSRDRSVTYRELWTMANGIAATLVDAGIGRGDRVAVFAPKSPEVVASLYGAMRSGCAYVPLDPFQPVVRAAAVANDCAPACLVTTAERAGALLPEIPPPRRPRTVLLPDAPAVARPLHLPGRWAGIGDASRSHADPAAIDRAAEATSDDLAYILYTSGSTGTPKGVMLTHRNALAFVTWAAGALSARSQDRFSSHAPLHFDLSVFDLYVAALAGAAVAIVPEEEAYLGPSLVRFIEQERLTIWYSVPTALMLITRVALDPGTLASLRAVVFAGEVYPTTALRSLRALVPDAELWNLYGPTETNVCTAYRVASLPEDDRPIPIGSACSGDEVFAVTDPGAVADAGEVGELFVTGPTVMRGYWGLPERTAEVLVPDPRAGEGGATAYRTGDLVRPRDDGDFDFIGRRDHQVKSRGYRIELGEVEAALLSHPSISEAVVLPVPDARWGSALVAHVVAAGREGPEEIDVKRHVAGRLPRYMVPVEVRFESALPRTATGKIDRRAIQTRWQERRAAEG